MTRPLQLVVYVGLASALGCSDVAPSPTRKAEPVRETAAVVEGELSGPGIEDAVFVDTELTLARESPAMAEFDLGSAEDKSLADALSRIETLVA